MTAPGEVYFRELPPLPDNPFPLGRNVKHDPQSRNFPFRAEHPETAPIDVEIEWNIGIGVLDQASIGACTGDSGTEAQAAGYEDCNSSLVDRGDLKTLLDQDYAYRLYADATAADGYQGTFTYPPPGGEDTGSDGLSIAKVLKNRGRIDRYTHGFSLNDCKVMIQHGGFMIGVPWFQGMFYPDANGIVTISGQLAGGHELFVRGRKQYFKHLGDLRWYWKIRNHWTEYWGVNGECFMSDDTLAQLLANDGDSTFLHFVTSTSPTPPGPPPFSWRSMIESWVESVARWLVNMFSRRTKP